MDDWYIARSDKPRVLSDVEIESVSVVTDSPFGPYTVKTETFRSRVRPGWLLRFRAWRQRRRWTASQRRTAERLAVALDEALLYGERDGAPDR